MKTTIEDLDVYDSQETVSVSTNSEFRKWVSQFHDNDEDIDEAVDRCRSVSVIDMINDTGDTWKYFTGQSKTTIHERVEWIKSNSDNLDIIDIVNEYLRAHCSEYDFDHTEE
jgi:hypothetical protein